MKVTKGIYVACCGLGLTIVLLGITTGSANAAGPTFGTKVTVNDGSGVLVDSVTRTVRASVQVTGQGRGNGDTTVRGPGSGNGTRSKTWMLYGRSGVIDNGKLFPLARLKTTVTYTLVSESYTERIWNYDFDRYFNICVKQLKDVTAEGGNVYCEVYHAARVRYRQTTRVVKNYPRARVTSEVTSWVNPICAPGATRVDTSSATEDKTQTCKDGETSVNPNPVEGCPSSQYLSYPQQTVTTAVVPRLTGKLETVTTTKLTCEPYAAGPNWITTATTALPSPTVTVTSITGPDFINYYTISGTLLNNYRGACTFEVSITNTAGTAHSPTIVPFASVASGATATWTTTYWSGNSYGVPTTTATAKATRC